MRHIGIPRFLTVLLVGGLVFLATGCGEQGRRTAAKWHNDISSATNEIEDKIEGYIKIKQKNGVSAERLSALKTKLDDARKTIDKWEHYFTNQADWAELERSVSRKVAQDIHQLCQAHMKRWHVHREHLYTEEQYIQQAEEILEIVQRLKNAKQ